MSYNYNNNNNNNQDRTMRGGGRGRGNTNPRGSSAALPTQRHGQYGPPPHNDGQYSQPPNQGYGPQHQYGQLPYQGYGPHHQYGQLPYHGYGPQQQYDHQGYGQQPWYSQPPYQGRHPQQQPDQSQYQDMQGYQRGDQGQGYGRQQAGPQGQAQQQNVGQGLRPAPPQSYASTAGSDRKGPGTAYVPKREVVKVADQLCRDYLLDCCKLGDACTRTHPPALSTKKGEDGVEFEFSNSIGVACERCIKFLLPVNRIIHASVRINY